MRSESCRGRKDGTTSKGGRGESGFAEGIGLMSSCLVILSVLRYFRNLTIYIHTHTYIYVYIYTYIYIRIYIKMQRSESGQGNHK